MNTLYKRLREFKLSGIVSNLEERLTLAGVVAKNFLIEEQSYFGRTYAASPQNCSKIETVI